MKFVNLRELKINTSKVIKSLNKEDAVITRNGKPAAALILLNEDLLDDYILAHHPAFLKEVDEAKDEYNVKGGIDHKTMKERILKKRG